MDFGHFNLENLKIFIDTPINSDYSCDLPEVYTLCHDKICHTPGKVGLEIYSKQNMKSIEQFGLHLRVEKHVYAESH